MEDKDKVIIRTVKIIDKDKLDELEIGTIFKSTNKLIEYLGIKRNHNTNEKERILDYISEYVEWETTGNNRAKNEIKITRIYKGLLIEPIEDRRIDTLTANTVGYMLLRNIKKFGKNDKIIFFSKGFLYQQCQMCNKNWSNINGDNRNIKELSETKEIDKENIYEFFDITNVTFRNNIFKGLRFLKNRKLIAYWIDSYAICDENGNHRLCTKDEIIAITNYELKILKLWGFKTTQEIWKRKRYRSFRKSVAKEIKRAVEREDKNVPKSLGNMEYFYEAIEIGYTYEDILFGLDNVTEVNELEANCYFMDKVLETIETKESNAKDNNKPKNETYKDDMNRLIDITMDKDTDTIIFKNKTEKVESFKDKLNKLNDNNKQ